MNKIEKILQPFFGKKRYYRFWQKAYKASLIGMNIGNGGNLDNSGERNALIYIKNHLIQKEDPVLFDVGANQGHYALELLKYFTKAQIHCFEPANQTFQTLSSNVQAPNVILNNFGASDKCSESILYSSGGENSGLASLYNRECFEQNVSETIKLDTLDHYCSERQISYIDFLKMDVEGNELKALYGAKEMLKSQKIGLIQVEFGGCNIDSGTYFRDFWNLLHQDYQVYRILRDGLFEIEEYMETLEIFTCTNYLFVSRKPAEM